MNRQEFIARCANLDEAQLLEQAKESRMRALGRIPEETRRQFRSLDAETKVQERYVQTAFGRTHLYLAEPREAAEEKRPVVINVHGGGWCLDHSERDVYFSRRLAHRLGCLVVDVDYVLAPEHPYPAALEEIEALLAWLPEHLEDSGICTCCHGELFFSHRYAMRHSGGKRGNCAGMIMIRQNASALIAGGRMGQEERSWQR